MHNLPFRQSGRFYRGNLHTHSTRSDCHRDPADVIATYRRDGYDFLALTDHFLESYGFPVTDTRSFRASDFTTLLGAELHAPATEAGDLWHIVAVGLPLDFAPTAAGESGPALAARARQAGAFVGIAHPAWYTLTTADMRSIEAAHAVEIYNETCAQLNDRGESWHSCELLLASGQRLTAFASDDAHFNPERPADMGGGWVHVRAESLEPEALLAALKAGHYYSSQGPQIHDIAIEGDHIHVACSPVRAIFVSGAGAPATATFGSALIGGRLPVGRFAGKYCRITVVDAAGKRAWSNPIWLPNDLGI